MSTTATDRASILPIYKPAGMTSFEVVQIVRNQLGLRKVGHAGTLDPLAEGLLIVLTGEKTKLMDDFLKLNKEYLATLQFGVVSKSHDLETAVTEQVKDLNLTSDEVEQVLSRFRGKIEQIPPSYSAKWVNGQRAYRLARQNVRFELKPKTVTIYKINVDAFSLPYAELRIECSSGTYVRSLARDIGKELGCGAVLSKLIRTRIGSYTIQNAVAVDEIKMRFAA